MSFACDAKINSPRGVDLLVQMATFARVVESGSISAAARHEKLSPAAVSRQLADLEAQLGVSLTIRTTRKLTVTDAGRAYYERVVRILRDVEDAGDAVGAGREPRGLLSVSAPVTFGLACIWPQLPALAERYPRLRVDLRLEDHVVDLVADGVDVAIRVGVDAPDSPGLVAHPLGSWERWLVAAPGYLSRRGVPDTPDAIAEHEAILHLPGAPWRFRRGEEEAVIQPAGRLRTNALLAVRDAALGGHGVALLPAWLVSAEIARGALRRLLDDWSLPLVTTSALHRAELRGAARVRAFIEHLRRTPLLGSKPPGRGSSR